MYNKKFWAAAFTLSGTIIGAGILGLPYVFSKSGFLIGLIWLIFLGAIILFINLALGEVTLRTKGTHQLTGYAQMYLGIWGKRIMLATFLFGIYSALLAYLIGEGESFSNLLPGKINPFFLGLIFWLIMTLLLREGLKGLKKVETYGVIAIIILVIGLFIREFPNISSSNLLIINQNEFMFPIGVILFSLLGFVSIPEVRRLINGQEKNLKKAILIGGIIPIILYSIFALVVVGVLGENIPQIATLSFGPIVTLLGIFTMLTSYFVLSFSLKDTFEYDLKLSRRLSFFLTSIVPVIIYTLFYLLKLDSFTKVLSIAGVITAGSTGILIVLMNKKAKQKSKKKNEINVPMNWIIIFLISLLLISGAILQLAG